MKTKSIFASKTAAAAFLTTGLGLVATFIPSVAEWTSANAGTLLMAVGGVAFVLRLVTKGKVSLFPGE